jgi:hypothetical protein
LCKISSFWQMEICMETKKHVILQLKVRIWGVLWKLRQNIFCFH